MAEGEPEFVDVIALAAFFISIWLMGRLFTSIGLSALPAQIGVGMFFGPFGLDIVKEFSDEYVPLEFLGFIGVSFVIFESGIHLDLERVGTLDIGGSAFLVAALGSAGAILSSLAFFVALGFDPSPDGLAAGFSIAPTSVGIGIALLTAAKQLHSHFGQLLLTAAVIDDVFSIFWLVILINLASGSLTAVSLIIPIILTMVFVFVGAAAAAYVLPRLMIWLLKRRKWHGYFGNESRSVSVRDEIHLFIMFATYILLSWIGDLIGSELLGAFVAGMLFSNVPRSSLVWNRQFKRATHFLMELFFAATVAFTIDLSALFTVAAFWKGCVMAAVPCLLTKLCCAFFVGPERWVIGAGMMARGEFAYLVAEQAHSEEQLTDEGYAVVVWALLWGTILPPIIFAPILKAFIIEQFRAGGEGMGRASRIGGEKFSGEATFIIRLTGSHSVGMVRLVCDSLHAQGLEVLQSSSESDGIVSTGTFVVIPREAIMYKKKFAPGSTFRQLPKTEQSKYQIVTDLDDESLDMIAASLKETIQDEDANIIFEATEKEEEVDHLSVVEIKLFGEHPQKVLLEITSFLIHDCELDVRRAAVSRNEIDYRPTFYCTRKPANAQPRDQQLALTSDAYTGNPSSNPSSPSPTAPASTAPTGSPAASSSRPTATASGGVIFLSGGSGSEKPTPGGDAAAGDGNGSGSTALTGASSTDESKRDAEQLVDAPRARSSSYIPGRNRGPAAADGYSSAISAHRKKSSTGVIAAPRGLSAAKIINATRAGSNISVIDIHRGNSSSSGVITASRAPSAASVILQPPPELSKTIEIVRKNTSKGMIQLGRKGSSTSGYGSQMVIKEIYSTFTAEQREFIRDGIRNIYSANGLHNPNPLVKMIHEEEMTVSVRAEEFFAENPARLAKGAGFGGHADENAAAAGAAAGTGHSRAKAVGGGGTGKEGAIRGKSLRALESGSEDDSRKALSALTAPSFQNN